MGTGGGGGSGGGGDGDGGGAIEIVMAAEVEIVVAAVGTDVSETVIETVVATMVPAAWAFTAARPPTLICLLRNIQRQPPRSPVLPTNNPPPVFTVPDAVP